MMSLGPFLYHLSWPCLAVARSQGRGGLLHMRPASAASSAAGACSSLASFRAVDVVAVDVLMRRVSRLLPDCTLRGYADDLALVSRSVWRDVLLEPVVSDFERVSGLALHAKKSVLVPPRPIPVDEVQSCLNEVAPRWGSFKIASHAKYPAFVVGPGRGEVSWDSAAAQFFERSSVWGAARAGMLHAIEAFRVFILPVMTFPAQLDPLPSNCGALEINAIRRRFPGPPWLVHARAPEVALARKLSQGTP
ncbi:unnamed protein product [Prorocentrum cordatum]|uniref:Reverse transcriptase domain-containing protein n=1 Tax=Prorocentrum cordatum TaxID=2364126 RepID=A0ABN9V8J0_9DINO|nr:unnamed protein product [Polarella glacialis]